MARIDCAMLCHELDERLALHSKCLVRVRDVSHRLHSRDVAVTGEQRVSEFPCHATGAVSRRENRLSAGALKEGHILHVTHATDIARLAQHNGVTIISREVQLVAEQIDNASLVGVDGHLGIKHQELVETVDVVEMSMSEQHPPQVAVNQGKNLVHITTIDQPRVAILTQDVTA